MRRLRGCQVPRKLTGQDASFDKLFSGRPGLKGAIEFILGRCWFDTSINYLSAPRVAISAACLWQPEAQVRCLDLKGCLSVHRRDYRVDTTPTFENITLYQLLLVRTSFDLLLKLAKLNWGQQRRRRSFDSGFFKTSSKNSVS